MNNKSNPVSKFKYPKKGILLTIHFLWGKKYAIIPYPLQWSLFEKKKCLHLKPKQSYEEESIQNNAFLFKLTTPIKDY